MKKVLLIAGGGTLGTYVSKELLKLGCAVDVICPEDKVSDHEHLHFIQSLATEELLTALFQKEHYDGIVNFIHYKDPEEYKQIHPLLMSGTDHLIFLSSYRVYADEQHPITEEAPRLTEVVKDPVFLTTETYAVPKSRCEDFLRNDCKGQPWTIVRPVISFSERRLDLLLYSGHDVIKYPQTGREMLLPDTVRNYKAGIDWAGNSGKLIAHLLFKQEAIGETFTVYSGHGMTWGEVADAYAARTGVRIRWCPEEEYVQNTPKIEKEPWMWIYDRKFNRDIDCSKILRVTGLKQEDFATVEDGIVTELAILASQNN